MRHKILANFFLVLAITMLGLVVMGYHPGLEDDGVYLSAVRADLNPALFPHDADFFRLQLQATVFDSAMAHFVRWTGISVAWSEFIWQFAALFLILGACRGIAEALFAERSAQWAAVAMVAGLFMLPVAGTALTIADPHLHPRNLATAFILLAAARILKGKRGQAIPLLGIALLFHPIMAALGISFCFFLTLALLERSPFGRQGQRHSLVAVAPLAWVFDSPNPSWRKALDAKNYMHLYQWAWYEWLGALAPLALFYLLWRTARKHGERRLSRFCLGVLAYGVVQQVLAMALLAPEALIRMMPWQPMRYLQLVYVFLALLAGGLLGRFLLKARVLRWIAFLLVLNGGMFAAQWFTVDEGAHLEMPFMASANPWLQAFDWIRKNTPESAYFALPPRYMNAPGEGFRSFRALAERSQLADGDKDTAMVTQVPSLAPAWDRQQQALAGFRSFQLVDFERLKREFGVDWALVAYPWPGGLTCPWHNGQLAVCRIP